MNESLKLNYPESSEPKPTPETALTAHAARPESSLPRVEFEVVGKESYDSFERKKIVIKHAGENVGTCDLILMFGEKAHFDGIELKEEYRGKGLGMAAYLMAIEIAHQAGLPFESQEISQSKDAKKIWESLAASGIAQVVEPFRLDYVHADGKSRYIGRAVVPVPPVA